MQRLLAAMRQQLQEPLGAGIERAAVDGDRRAGQQVDPGDRHAQRQVGGLALQLARDLLQLHRAFSSMSSTDGHPLASFPQMAETSGDFAQALRREIMRSEQQRMRVLAAILFFILCLTSIGLQVLPELRERLFPGGISWWMPVAAIGPFVLYELAAVAVLSRRMAAGKDFPQPA